MELKEKLDGFYRAAMGAAEEQSHTMLDKYRKEYEGKIAEYRQAKERERQTRETVAKEHVRREINRRLSEEMLRLKKEYHSVQEDKKAELFALAEKKLSDFRATEAYRQLLAKRIQKAIAFAQGEALRIYIDPADEGFLQELERECGCELLVSGYPFGGGMRAVIPSKNVLIDESFDSRLSEEKENFSF